MVADAPRVGNSGGVLRSPTGSELPRRHKAIRMKRSTLVNRAATAGLLQPMLEESMAILDPFLGGIWA
jgi:hypothetical protein